MSHVEGTAKKAGKVASYEAGRTQQESSATASGAFSLTPRDSRSRATIPATASRSLDWSDGDSCTGAANVSARRTTRHWTAG